MANGNDYEEDYIILDEEEQQSGYTYSGNTYGTGIPSGPGSSMHQLAALAHIKNVQDEARANRWKAGGVIAGAGGKFAYDEYRLADRKSEGTLTGGKGQETWLSKWRDRKNVGPKHWDPKTGEYVSPEAANTPKDMKVDDPTAITEPTVPKENVLEKIEKNYNAMQDDPNATTELPKDFEGMYEDQITRNQEIQANLEAHQKIADPYKAQIKADGTLESGTDISIRLQKEKIKKLDNQGHKKAARKNQKYHQLEKEKLELAKMDNNVTTHSSQPVTDATGTSAITDNYNTWDPKVAEYIELPDGSRVPKTIEYVAPKEIPAMDLTIPADQVAADAAAQATKEAATTAAEKGAGTAMKTASKVVGGAMTAYQAYNLASNWDDMDNEDRLMGLLYGLLLR
jgi:hypothetical protein